MPRISIYTKGRVRDHGRSGGATLLLRTTYTPTQRKALHQLAESNPTPETYARERARILEANR